MEQNKETEQMERELPGAFCEKMRRMLGEEYPAFVESYGKSRVQGLRFNPWKVDSEMHNVQIQLVQDENRDRIDKVQECREAQQESWKTQFHLQQIPVRGKALSMKLAPTIFRSQVPWRWQSF